MIRELSTRLYNKLSGNGTLVGLTTGIYLGKAPQNQDYAYITFWPVSETSRHMHDSIIEDTLLILLLGADINAILWGRIIFTFIVVAAATRFMSHLGEPFCRKFFYKPVNI
mgnify:CR=1 FL=1